MAVPLAVLGIGSTLFGGFSGARAARKARHQQQRITRANVAGLNALAVSDARQARVALRNFQWDAHRFQGNQLATITGSGLNADFGSAAQIRAQDAQQIVKDAITIETNARERTRQTLHAVKLVKLGGTSALSQIQNQGLSALYEGIGGAARQGANLFAAYSD